MNKHRLCDTTIVSCRFPIAAIIAAAAFLAGCASGPAPEPPAYPSVTIASSCPHSAPNTVDAARAASSSELQTETLIASTSPSRTARVLLDEAYAHALDGNRAEAIRLYDLAVRFPDNDRPIDRVQWSYGWGMFALNDYACALARFEAAREAAPTNTSWLPHTLAVVYWRMGDKPRALDWYGVAVRNMASCWADPKNVATCTKRWHRHEQRAILEVNAAWRARRFQ